MSNSLQLRLFFTFFSQGFLTIFLLSLYYISFGPRTANAIEFDVTSYGAKGDGNTDDSKAFIRAWDDLCKDESSDPTLIVPSGKTFLISPVAFNGPCNYPTIHIKLLGDLTAPKTLDEWNGCAEKHFWIYFSSVKGLMIDGPGQFDGQGSIWWINHKASTKTCNRPSALHFHACDGLRLKGTTHINSPKLHISINSCEDVDIGDIRISAPKDSPNTDGIDISESSHVNIHDSNIQTGDDCVAINGGVYDLNVTGVFCGPGHGISIGSLGEKGSHDTVEKVRVENCNITGTQNGLRIKTVPHGTGYAKEILFREIHLPSAAAVQVSDVTYENIYGSSASAQAITFSCSGKYKCTGIQTNGVGITGDDAVAYCKNAQGKFVDTNPHVTCN